MAIIPLKQSVIISPFIRNDPDYGEPEYGGDYTRKCRFQEGVKLVRNRHGAEVVSVGAFLLDKLPEISINDLFTYTDENMRTTTYTPIAISVKRAINGKPLLTEVSV